MEGRYDEAIRMIRVPKEALAKATDYTSRGIELPPDLMPETLTYMFADQCAKRKDKTALLEVLRFMSDPHRKVRYLKKGGLYAHAMDLYDSLDEPDEAYRLAKGQCLFLEGRKMAKKHNDMKTEAQFVFHQIHAEFFIRNGDKEVTLPQHFEADLHDLLKGEVAIKAHALLLLGLAKKDATQCRAAHGNFHRSHKVAALEAFDALTSLCKDRKPNTTQVLQSCTAAKDVMNALKGMNDLHQLVKQTTSFYGLQQVRDVYLMPPNHNMWVSEKLRSRCRVSNEPKDLDGMLRLQMKETREALAFHVGSFIEKWLDKYGVEADILKRLQSFKLHDDIEKYKYLLRLYTPTEISSEALNLYMKAIVDYGSLGLVTDQQLCVSATDWMLTVFSPEVSLCLSLSKQHVRTVRAAISLHKYFHERIRQILHSEHCNRMDMWISAWRACALTDGKIDHVQNALNVLEEGINHQFKQKPVSAVVLKDGKVQTGFAYQYWKLERYNYHIFSYWLYSCSLIRDEKKPLWAAKQAIYYFIGKIVQRKSLSISVINLVNVLIIHSMSIFAMLTQLNHQQNKMSTKFIVPVSYHDCVMLFDALNCRHNGTSVYASSIEDVQHHVRTSNEVTLEKDCYGLLNTALNILLGTYRKDPGLPVGEQKRFKVLHFAFFRNEIVLKSGAARHCLVLALTLFINLIPYQNPNKFELTKRFFFSSLFNHLHTETVPGYLKEARAIFESSPSMQILRAKLGHYVGHLLSEGCAIGTQTQALMRINERGKISCAPLPSKPAHLPPNEQAVQHPLNTTSLPQPHTVPPSAVDPIFTVIKQPHSERENEAYDSQAQSFRQTAMQPNTPLPLATGTVGVTYSHQPEYSGIPSVVNQRPVYTASPSTTTGPTAQQLVLPPQASRENQHQYSPYQPFTQPVRRPDTTVPQHLGMTGGPYQPSQQVGTVQSGHITLPLEASLLHLPAMENHPTFGQGMTTYSHSIPPSVGSELPWEDFPQYQSPPPPPQPPVGATHFYQQPFGYSMQHLPSHNLPPMQSSYQPPMPYWDGSTPMNTHYNHLSEYQQQPSSIQPETFPTTIHQHRQNISQEAMYSTTTHQTSTLSSPPATLEEGPVHTHQPAHQDVSDTQQSTEASIPQSPVPMTASFENEVYSLNPDRTHSPPEITTFAKDYDEANIALSVEEEGIVDNDDDMPSLEATDEPQEEEELDEDKAAEEGPGMLAMRKSKWPHLPTIDPALIDPSIVTEEFCNICGVSLRQSNPGEDSEEPDGENMAVQPDEEAYDTHVRSTGHAQQHIHHKKFKELYDGCYSNMVKELADLLHNCEIIQAPTLTKLKDDMYDSLDKYEMKMVARMDNLQWRIGIKDIEKAIDEFQRLLTSGNRQYQKVLSEQPWNMTDEQKAPREYVADAEDSDTEFQAEINKTVDVSDDNNLTLEPRSEEAKLAARSRKKNKRRKRQLS